MRNIIYLIEVKEIDMPIPNRKPDGTVDPYGGYPNEPHYGHMKANEGRLIAERDEARTWALRLERRALKAERERDKLAAALKKIKTLPFYTTERVWAVIDAALDGVEVDEPEEENPWKDCDCLNCKPRNQKWARDALDGVE